MVEMKKCCFCGAQVGIQFRFCDQCGELLDSSDSSDSPKLYSSLMQGKEAVIRFIRGGEWEGKSVILSSNESLSFGHGESDVVINDSFLSNVHMKLYWRDNSVYVSDEDSQNGVYMRIFNNVSLMDGDMLMAGEHYFLYEDLKSHGYSVSVEGLGELGYRLSEVIEGGTRGRSRVFSRKGICVGSNMYCFSIEDDVFMSAHHFEIKEDDSRMVVRDLGSSNGLYLRLRGGGMVKSGDMLFIGHHLLRVYY